MYYQTSQNREICSIVKLCNMWKYILADFARKNWLKWPRITHLTKIDCRPPVMAKCNSVTDQVDFGEITIRHVAFSLKTAELVYLCTICKFLHFCCFSIFGDQTRCILRTAGRQRIVHICFLYFNGARFWRLYVERYVNFWLQNFRISPNSVRPVCSV